MSATSILINIGAQTAGAVRGIQDVNGALGKQLTAAEKTKVGLKKMMPVALAAGGALVTAGALAVNAASNQQQAFGALDSVFKKNSDSMKEWALEQGDIGLSATEAGNAASLMGSLFQNAGLKAGRAAEDSQKYVELGADLAATFGGPATDAVDALSAAFKGEFDSLEKYGVSLKKSDVNARLAKKGQDKLTGAALKQAEAIATQELIWKQTADAQGQAARESDTVAGSMATLKAEFDNAAASIGEVLLPYVAEVTEKFSAFATWAGENEGTVQAIATVIGVLAAAVITANVAMGVWNALVVIWSAVTAVASAVGAVFGAVIAVITSPITLVVLAIIAFIAIIVLLYKNWDKVSAFLKRTWEAIKDKAVEIFNKIKDFLVNLWGSIKDKAKELFNKAKEAISEAWDKAKEKSQEIMVAIAVWLYTKWREIKDKAKELFEQAKEKIKEAFTKAKEKIHEIWNGLKTWLSNAWDTIKDKAVTAFTTLKEKISSAFEKIKTSVKEKITDLIDKVKALPGKILSALGNLGSLLFSKGKDLIQGLINGIKSMGSAILNAILGLLPGPLKSLVRGALGFSVPEGVGAGISPMSGSRRYGNTATINLYGSATPSDARVIKRALEGYDVAQGRYAGQPLAVAW